MAAAFQREEEKLAPPSYLTEGIPREGRDELFLGGTHNQRDGDSNLLDAHARQAAVQIGTIALQIRQLRHGGLVAFREAWVRAEDTKEGG
jgi:hypothetical protein